MQLRFFLPYTGFFLLPVQSLLVKLQYNHLRSILYHPGLLGDLKNQAWLATHFVSINSILYIVHII